MVWRRLAGCMLSLWVAAAGAGSSAAAAEAADPFAHPPELERDVRFWIRVYTEVDTNGGLLHDSWNLGLVYEVLRFEPDLAPGARERRVTQAKAHYAVLLRRFAAGDTAALSAHERRILHQFGEHATAAQFLAAIERIRFQLGQSDRFHEGLARAANWEGHIAAVLKRRGVPEEIAALPHVESSFNPAAYSRVGAAGLWQFMPGTARRFMRVDGLVDERLDPDSATEAAANLMLYNYRLLGTWPLAVTAYNHGPAGLRRAQDELGSSDIAVIVKRYQGATFGFASRNFYVAFLAALEIDRNAEKFFGPITRLPDPQSVTVEVPDYVPVDALAKAFKVDRGALQVLNPALRPPIWSGARFVPRGYALRVPGAPAAAEIAAAFTRLLPAQRFVAQRNDATHRVRGRETAASIAARSGVALPALLAVNGWKSAPSLKRGQLVRLPLPASRAGAAVVAETPAPAPNVETTPQAPAPAAVAVAANEPVYQPAAQTEAILPVSPPTGSSDGTDYTVRNGAIVVQPAETLGHYADWSGVSAQQLRRLNRLRTGTFVGIGHKFRLDLSRVGAAGFEAARRGYHKRLQDVFFAAHRIAGTENYVIRRGDSLWTIAAQRADLPVWLVTQYNPDVDFSDLRPGSSIALPKVSAVNRE